MKELRKTNEVVIESIIISLVELLEQKSFDDISIVEIITHAGVSRNSFYRNFKNKEDILVQYITKITADFVETSDITSLSDSWENYIYTLFLHLYNNRNVTDIFIKNDKMHLIREVFDNFIVEKTHGRLDSWHAYFLSGGLFNLYCHWAKNDYGVSIDTIAQHFSQVVLGI